MRRVLFVASVATVLGACEPPRLPGGTGGFGVEAGGDAASSSTSSYLPASSPTYHGFVRGFIEAHCAKCHVDGGLAPFSLDTWDVVELAAPDIVAAVETGEMPPYLPRDGCRDIDNAQLVPRAATLDLGKWRDAGFPEGNASEYPGPADPPPEPPDLGDPDMVLTVQEPFTPDASAGDVVQEWLLEDVFAADTWVVATEIAPTAAEIVHHANAFVEPGAEPPPELPAPASIVGAWAPGYAPLVLPPSSALFVPAGARVRLIVHYSTVTLGIGEPVPSDMTELRFWTLPEGSAPEQLAFFDPISQSDLFVPAYDDHVDVTGERELSLPGAPIVGVVPHMHLLGAAFHAEVAHADETTTCLADVPSYDFFHQTLWLFSEPVDVVAGDLHRMTCTFDNSPENQPLVNGVPKIPVDVSWGDASTDEMCMNALLRVIPLD